MDENYFLNSESMYFSPVCRLHYLVQVLNSKYLYSLKLVFEIGRNGFYVAMWKIFSFLHEELQEVLQLQAYIELRLGRAFALSTPVFFSRSDWLVIVWPLYDRKEEDGKKDPQVL